MSASPAVSIYWSRLTTLCGYSKVLASLSYCDRSQSEFEWNLISPGICCMLGWLWLELESQYAFTSCVFQRVVNSIGNLWCRRDLQNTILCNSNLANARSQDLFKVQSSLVQVKSNFDIVQHYKTTVMGYGYVQVVEVKMLMMMMALLCIQSR